MDIVKHSDGIYQINNFLSAKELDTINQMLSDIPKDFDSWTLSVDAEDVEDSLHPWWSGKIYRAGQSEFLWSIYEKLLPLFSGCNDIDISHIIDFQRTLPGDRPMTVHTDDLGSPTIHYGIVIYLNDNYNGGEIAYPENNIVIKPSAGMAAIHLSNIPHGVQEVFDGPRYIFTSFVSCSHKLNDCSLSFSYS